VTEKSALFACLDHVQLKQGKTDSNTIFPGLFQPKGDLPDAEEYYHRATQVEPGDAMLSANMLALSGNR
ncbi:unnamed protein product, partial [Linum tenue]